MAKDTNLDLRNQVIYQVFPRQHSATGDFKGLIADLDRIKALGVDILYLLPIHPIGEKNKKGTIGCPYSIQDYRKIHPSLGTLQDFKKLIEETHIRQMKLMIDIVFNHTSRDSVILNTHPEWMYQKDGKFSGKVGDWWDVTDLDYSNKALWKELISVLCYWAKLGVDGYRCDVASMVPLEFWIEARKELKKINPDFVMLAESIDLGFVKHIRDSGFEATSDCELYEAFDMEYDYDLWRKYEHYLETKENLEDWLDALRMQECIYPKNYIKAHALENHDRKRAAIFVKDGVRLRNLNALIYFLKGTTFIYAGQEACEEKLESLFEIDPIDWSGLGKYNMPNLMKRCYEIKKDPIFRDGVYTIHNTDLEVVQISYETEKEIIECILNVGNVNGGIKSLLMDGEYKNLFNGESISIQNKRLQVGADPIIIKAKK
ncbi:MAG: alpha-amylase family glycosyl hydrolase [Roseburia sp.]|nr:alpha-amylase family glycosyl hydrolase [Anaeroplasma bactoclasticum]MCM1196188.1 alpha-amylase family glycosyl hydrolase [Roseburia sp.]MCM1557269.1 alpha-amylase family glycosyl hydrolase [Anaeroplasma bactoclasticum]